MTEKQFFVVKLLNLKQGENVKRKLFTALAGIALLCVWTASNFLLSAVQAATVLSEGFEAGNKAAYAAANVTLGSGSWYLNEALTGNTSSDRKTGSWSARVRCS